MMTLLIAAQCFIPWAYKQSKPKAQLQYSSTFTLVEIIQICLRAIEITALSSSLNFTLFLHV